MPTKHARCSASAAYRWINCPGSVALSDQCPDPGTSSYADEGTLAHSLAELKLRHALHEITDAQYKKRLAKIQQDDYYNGEMDEVQTAFPALLLTDKPKYAELVKRSIVLKCPAILPLSALAMPT